MKMEAKVGIIWPQIKGYLEPPAAGRDKEGCTIESQKEPIPPFRFLGSKQ